MERNENKSKLNVSELKCETSILFVMCMLFFLMQIKHFIQQVNGCVLSHTKRR